MMIKFYKELKESFLLLHRQFELRSELLKDNILLQVAKSFADLISNMLMSICILLAFLFSTMTLGFLLCEVLKNYVLGFGLLTLFYLVLALIVFKKGSFVEKLLINLSIGKLLSKFFYHDPQK
ncbi:hypothetical protein [Pedobacter aquatilis]|uniref:hypothetical protein n=1 Tax=Pedobacter aquatilis TaxID=351343 RepID=UPI00292DDCF7|nr:hypothetical protein [Pedobacter aquatilis]